MRPSRIRPNYRLQILQKRWWNVFEDICTMDRWSFWSWFDVNQPTWDENTREKNDFYIFVNSDLDLWPLDLKFASVVTLAQTYVFTAFEISASFVLRENRRHGTNGQTDRQTDGHGATLNAPPTEGRTKLDHCYDQEFVISSPIASDHGCVPIGCREHWRHSATLGACWCSAVFPPSSAAKVDDDGKTAVEIIR